MTDKLPKTADGVPITPRMVLWQQQSPGPPTSFQVAHLERDDYDRIVIQIRYLEDGSVTSRWPSQCYSTKEAAEAAKETT